MRSGKPETAVGRAIRRAGKGLRRAFPAIARMTRGRHPSIGKQAVKRHGGGDFENRSPGVSLWSDFLMNDQRVIHKWKHYFPIYERHFRDYVYKTVTFVEIGVGQGGSLQMWKRYFGPHARIIGIDINPDCREFAEDQIEIRIGSQEDVGFLRSIVEEFGAPDIILDDGSHVMSHVSASFNYLYPRLTSSGVYMVEDLHTAYSDKYGGGLNRPGTFIEFCKALIDELNADHIPEGLSPTEFTRGTMSMHFYDSVVVFERGRHTRKMALCTPV